MEFLKIIFRRDRPNINQLIGVSGYSFPSGHSVMSMIIYGYTVIIIYRYFKHKFKWLLILFLSLLILTVGISRIYLGVHYATDVIFGYSVGIIVLSLFNIIVDKIISKTSK